MLFALLASITDPIAIIIFVNNPTLTLIPISTEKETESRALKFP